MSKTIHFKREERDYEMALDEQIEQQYERAYQNQRKREALLWERRKSNPQINNPQPSR